MESRCEIGTLVQRSYNRWAALRIYANLCLMTPGARYRGHVPRCEARWPPPCPASTSPPPPASDTPPPCHSCPASRAASLHYYNIYTTTSNTTISSTGGAPATPTRVGMEASATTAPRPGSPAPADQATEASSATRGYRHRHYEEWREDRHCLQLLMDII